MAAILVHEADQTTQKQLNESRFYGERVTLTVVGEPSEQVKSAPSMKERRSAANYESRLSKLVKMPGYIENEKTKLNVKGETNETPLYYKLSYVKSLTHFYIHSSETMKQLRRIEDELETEWGRKTTDRVVVSDLQKGQVYGYFVRDENKYYRVRWVDSNDEAFFIDFGYMRSVNKATMFEISDWLAQITPEARCCRLSGFKDREMFTELTNVGNNAFKHL